MTPPSKIGRGGKRKGAGRKGADEESLLLERLWIGTRCDEIERAQQRALALAATFPDGDLKEITDGQAALNALPLPSRKVLNPDAPVDRQQFEDEDADAVRHDIAAVIGDRGRYVAVGSGHGRRAPGEKTRADIMAIVAVDASEKFGRQISSRMVERAWKFSRALAAHQEAELDAEEAQSGDV